jgi:hypothetical protein
MPQAKINLKGWQAALGLIILIGLIGFRVVAFQDETHNDKLMRDLKMQIVSDYLPNETARLRAAVDSGDEREISKVAGSVTGARPVIDSVKISAPLLDFATSQEVVIRVVYSLSEGTLSRDRKTLYFLYKYGAIGNIWSYQYETTATRYYLNFI